MTNAPLAHGALDRVRPLYWSARGLVRSRALDFFVCERQPRLPPPEQVEIRFGSAGHEDAAARLAASRGQDPAEYRARLTAGHQVIYAIGADGDFRSWGWITAPTDGPRDSPWEFGIRLRVMPGTGFLWDYFTMPAYRGRGLYKALLRHSAEQCFVRGAMQVWIYADVTNSASRHAIAHADFTERTRIRVSRIGPLCRIAGPGFQRIVRSGGMTELDSLLPHRM